MTIHQLAHALNELAISGDFRIAQLPELRKQFLGKKQLPGYIFHQRTIFAEPDKYAFHYGGRDEMQFNVGEETINGKKVTRYGLCFSLESSRSLPQPVKDLDPYRRRYNVLIASHLDLFEGFSLWHYRDDKRSANSEPQEITDELFRQGNFICLGAIIKKSLDALEPSDLVIILNGFDRLLPIYEYCILESAPAEIGPTIFTRLTSNDSKWQLPTGHEWNEDDQGKKNVAFENQYGFGYEEWLLNPRYLINGYQYGFIRGLQHSDLSIPAYKRVHLYTVKKIRQEKLVYYIGYIDKVEVIRDNPLIQAVISEVFDRFKGDMVDEIQNVQGDINGLTAYPVQPVVRFRTTDVKFLEEPALQPHFPLGTYKRFQPYQLTGPIEAIFEDTEQLTDPQFVSGKANQTNVYDRKNRKSTRTIIKTHTEIIEALEIALQPEHSLREKNISIEKMRFHGNIADLVTKEADNSISIYEIKTSISGRINIRDAISQLLDYALHSGSLKIKKLVIVSPSFLTPLEIRFMNSLKATIGLTLEYLCYKKDAAQKFLSQ